MPQQIASVVKPWIPIKDVPGGDVGSVHGRAPSPGNQYYGPFIYGDAYYAVIEVGQPSNNYWIDWYLAVMKSTDAGLTWAEVDAADHLTGHEVNCSIYKSGNILYIAWKKRNTSAAGDYNLLISSFNLATEQWASVATGGPNPGGGATGTKMVIRPNGDYVILTNTGTNRSVVDFPTQGVHYVIYDGSWGSPVLVSPDDPDYKSQQIQLDSVTANLVHFYYVYAGFASSDYKHRSLNAADALGTAQAILTPSTIMWALGVPTVYGGNLIVPCIDDTGAVYYPWVLIGTAEGDADPVWSLDQISDTVKIMPPANADNNASFALLNGDGDLVVFWVTPIPNTGMGVVNFLMYSVYDGVSWGDPAIWVEDEVTNAYQDWWHNPSVVLDSNDVFQVVIDRIHRTYDNNAWSVAGFLYTAPAAAENGVPYTW